MIGHKKVILVSVLLLFFFLTVSGVSAVEDNITDELSGDLAADEIVAEDLDVKLENSDENDLVGEEEGWVDASEAYKILNDYRTEKGAWFWEPNNIRIVYFNTHEDNQLQPLIRDVELEETAKIRAKECSVKYSHTRPDGSDCFSAYPDKFWTCGENLAPAVSAEMATEAWKEDFLDFVDQGHRRNMLSNDFTHVGIAGYRAADGTIYWTQAFGGDFVEIEKKNQTPPDSSQKTFSDLNALIKNSTDVRLQTDYVYYNNDELRGGIVIDRPLTVDGCGHTIDARKYGRIFNITSDNVILKNINFENAYIDFVHGGAIYSIGKNLTILNCSFKDNFAYYGSCVASTAGDVSFEGCSFSDNYGVEGSSVYLFDADGDFRNCDFINNAEILYGTLSSSNSKVTVEDCRFIGNVGYKSGALNINCTDSSFINCRFIENVAQLEGGAISLNASIADFTCCNFTDNVLDCKYYAYGGAVYASGSDITFDTSNFNNNSLYSKYSYSTNGGAAYLSEGNFSFTDCSFDDNAAGIFGGALCLSYSNNSVVNCSFRKNNLTRTDMNTHGGAIYSEGHEITVEGCTFTDNAGYYGGAVATCCGEVTIVNNTFNGGCGRFYAGAIYSEEDNITIVECSFENNSGTFDGGAVSVFNSNATIEDCSFINSTCEYGGALYLADAYVDIVNCDFIKNSVYSSYDNANGGAIFVNGGHVCLNECNFTDNSAHSDEYSAGGGAVYSMQGNVNISDCRFTDNNAVWGIAIHSRYGEISVVACDFVNDALYEGCAIYSDSSNVHVEDCDITGHTAGYGPCLYLVNGNVSIVSCDFTDNFAKYASGGAVYLCYCNARVENSNFNNNKADNDAGALLADAGEVSLINCSFTNNIAAWNGGAVSLVNGNFTVMDCRFNSNTVNSNSFVSYGGAIKLSNANADVISCSFTDNYVNASYDAYGGAVSCDESEVSLQYCNFTSNRASQGSCIYSSKSKIDVLKSNFMNNNADFAGTVYSAEGNLTITDSDFIENFANSNGGAVYSIDGNLTVKDTDFIENFANSGGGAIYLYNSNADFIGSTFTNNSVNLDYNAYGGAVYSANSKTTLKDSTFKNNTAFNGAAVYGCDAIGCTFEDNYATGTAAAIYGDNNFAENCRFIRNTAFGDNPTYNVTVKDCTSEDNIILKRAQLDIEYLEAEYYQGDLIYAYLYSGYYQYINNATVTLRAYKGDVLADTFEFSSGDGWTVNITEGTYLFVFSVEEPDYVVSPVNATVTIIKNEIADVRIDVSDNTYSQETVVKVTGNVDGGIGIYLDDSYWDYMDVEANKSAEISLGYPSAGSHEIRIVITPSNPRVVQKTFTKSFTVNKKPTSVAVDVADVTDDENVFVNIWASEDGTVEIKIGDAVQYVNVIADDESCVDMGIFSKGSYSVEATFSAGDNYIDSSASKTFRVLAKISQEDIKITPPGEGSRDIPVSLPADAKGKVTLTIAGEDYEFDVVDGKAIVIFPDVTGDNSYTITYSGDDQYAGFSMQGSYSSDKDITINPDMKVTEFEDGTAHVTLPSDATGTVTLTVNGEKYSFDVSGGIVTLALPALADGNYEYEISYSGDDKYEGAVQNGNVEIINPSITASNAKVTYTAGTYYQIAVKGFGGKPAAAEVVIKVNGKKFKTISADADGKCKFKVTQIPGTYKLEITSIGVTKTATLTVKHLMTLKKVTVKKSAKKLVLTATLAKINKKYLKGKKITFKFNGKKYTAKTNKKGVAKVTIKSTVLKKLKVSKKVTYQATYLKDTVKYSIKVKK